MNAAPGLSGLIATVTSVLIVATVIGRVLAVRSASKTGNSTIQNLNARIDAWWIMVTFGGLALAFGKFGVIVLFAVLSFAALREFITLTRVRPEDHWALLTAFFVAVPLQYYLIAIEWYGLYSILIPVYAFAVMPMISVLRAEPKAFLERTAEAQWGLMIAVYCLSYVAALATLPIAGYEGRGVLLIGYLLLISQASDVLQYVWGKLLGRTPIAPTLSPAKTVEGCVLGIASAVALGTVFSWLTPFEPWQAAVLTLVTTTLGFMGGLVMSAIKRDRGVKDWGSVIPGHGGLLDRLDSLVFGAPVFFHMTRYWWAG
jgi:phosphatidate cytidylyltransferase